MECLIDFMEILNRVKIRKLHRVKWVDLVRIDLKCQLVNLDSEDRSFLPI
jgi:hypothetical protein